MLEIRLVGVVSLNITTTSTGFKPNSIFARKSWLFMGRSWPFICLTDVSEFNPTINKKATDYLPMQDFVIMSQSITHLMLLMKKKKLFVKQLLITENWKRFLAKIKLSQLFSLSVFNHILIWKSMVSNKVLLNLVITQWAWCHGQHVNFYGTLNLWAKYLEESA